MNETVTEHCKHKDCRYRGRLSFADEACFYMYYTGEPRGCPISKCNRYKPGKIKWSLSLDGIRYMDDDLQVWTCTYGLMIKPNGFCNYGEVRDE